MRRILWVAVLASSFLAALSATEQAPTVEERFDYLVREDFFAGLRGDEAAFNRAMKLCEATLAKDPQHAQAMVWHGSGLLALAGAAFAKQEVARGEDMWRRGLQEMDRAVSLAPTQVGVLIPRGATLLEVSRHVSDDEGRRLLKQAVDDYEKVLALQAPYFARLSAHARGELLFGLADGWHRLGDPARGREYLKRVMEEAVESGHAKRAAEWIDNKGTPVRTPGCIGCHDASVQSQPIFDRDWPAIVTALETAALMSDAAALRAGTAQLAALQKANLPPDRAPLVHYAIAYASWRLSVVPASMSHIDPEGRGQLLDRAVEELRAALSINERDAEAHALLSAVYGLQIGDSMWKGMALGPKSNAEVDRALELEPNNPRALMGKGIGAFHTPAIFGGGADKAERFLRRALALFEQEPADRLWPNWGRLDAHAWLGQVLAAEGDVDGARAEYEKALAIAPQSGWVRYVLLPALDRKKGR